MTVWSEPLSILRRRRILQKICLALLFVVIITTTLFIVSQRNAEAAPSTVSFTARLKTADGSVVPDGFYNIGFKLYGQLSGGSAIWSENYYDENGATAGEDYRVRVINGHFSVKLGSRTAFGETVNWQDNLWLTMNIGGTAQQSDLGLVPWDGEMSPRIELTASPYSMNSGAVGGKTSNQLVQLGQGAQIDNSSLSSIHINKIGSGNLIQLQSSGVDIFSVNSTGSITLGSNINQSISVGTVSSGVGQNLAISAGSSANNNGGALVLQGGNANGVAGKGGDVNIDAGQGETGGDILLGSVNAGKVTIGNSGSTTQIEGELQAGGIDTSTSSGLAIGKTNASSIELGQNTTISEDKTLTVNGDTTIKSGSTDTTNTFNVQKADNTSLLSVDALNNRIAIGTTDDIGALLVLDTKTTEGDPTGANGAMYYNSDAAKFRCYEAGEWKDCITPLPVSVTAQIATVTDQTTPVDVTNMSFALAANTKYYYKFVVMHSSDETTTGSGFGITAPAGVGMSSWCINTTALTNTASPGLGSYCGTDDASTTTTGADNPGNYFTSNMEGYIQTGSTAGDLKLRFKSELTGKEVSIDPKSFGILQIVQ